MVSANGKNILEIEAMAKFLRAINISNIGKDGKAAKKVEAGKRKKWTRKMGARKNTSAMSKKVEVEMEKRNLINIMVIDGTVERGGSGEKKLKALQDPIVQRLPIPEVVLESQHCLHQ